LVRCWLRNKRFFKSFGFSALLVNQQFKLLKCVAFVLYNFLECNYHFSKIYYFVLFKIYCFGFMIYFYFFIYHFLILNFWTHHQSVAWAIHRTRFQKTRSCYIHAGNLSRLQRCHVLTQVSIYILNKIVYMQSTLQITLFVLIRKLVIFSKLPLLFRECSLLKKCNWCVIKKVQILGLNGYNSSQNESNDPNLILKIPHNIRKLLIPNLSNLNHSW
jgi:hypothetical protein